MTQLSTTQTEAIANELETIQKNFGEAQEKFKTNFATNPVYALEWNAPLVARTQGSYEVVAPLIARLTDEMESEKLVNWLEGTIEQLENRLLDPSGDAYAPSSSSVTANWLKVETTRGSMEARQALKRMLKIVRN